MNIFVTDSRPLICAEQHCDVHLRNMIVETAQILSTAHVELDGIQVAYKSTHKNDPSCVWVRSDYKNYRWTSALLYFLLKEYKGRFGKEHKTSQHFAALATPPRNITGSRINSKGFMSPENFVMAMPEEFKQESVETSYRDYLNTKFAEWRSRERPMKVEWTNRPVPGWVSL